MDFDQTEHQTGEDLLKAEQLSLKRTSPPAEVPGYIIQGFLGSGAYGEVWHGIDQNTGRRVAIKFYTRRSSVDFTMLSREVEKLAQLAADRYVVQLLDVGWDCDPPYYVMDHIEHGSLEELLKERGSYSISEALEMFQEVAVGLMHLHSRGILHCDLKPGNVLLDQDHKPRLADFGQSRLSHEQTAALGTLFYMAPEQADLEAIPDARWDVYALGALLYTMLTGTPPYRTSDVLAKVETVNEMDDRLAVYRKAIAASPAPNKHRKVAGVDRQLAEIIDRCIARNPDDRFEGIQSVLVALRQREESRARRPLMILGLVGPLALLLVMGLFGLGVYNRAIKDTNESLTTQAQESNNWAAQLAAQSAGEQVDDYFRAISAVTKDPEFHTALQDVLQDDALKELFARTVDPDQNANNSPAAAAIRDSIVNSELRQRLDSVLRKHMDLPDAPKTASWFVCDLAGTQIASVFKVKAPTITIGRNYSYRTYFHGGPLDLKSTVGDKTVFEVSDNVEEREIIEHDHMSAIFTSKASNTWKVAFSTPVRLAVPNSNGDLATTEPSIIAVVACTVEMGDFIDFNNQDDLYAMLVDNRPGADGIVLEHPVFVPFTQSHEPLPPQLKGLKVDLDKIGETNEFFADPVSRDELGKKFDRDWFAAKAKVRQRTETSEKFGQREDTGLVVLTMRSADEVLSPVKELGTRLLQIGLAALGVVTIVATCLWYLVMRSVRESRDRVNRAFRSATENSLMPDTIRHSK